MVYNDSTVEQSSTLWGNKKNTINLVKSLQQMNIKYPIYVLNDVSAAGYVYTEKYSKFCIITVSSGIGNKCFWNRELLLNNGLGGEIGHVNIGHEILDDSGFRGHLGAIASGRGSVKYANLLKRTEPELFKTSILNGKKIDTYRLIEAYKANDNFSIKVIRYGIRNLAKIINVHIHSLGIAKYIIIGGFALALGEDYIVGLKQELQSLKPYIINEEEINDMIELGSKGDFHCLKGAGIFGGKKVKSSIFYNFS